MSREAPPYNLSRINLKRIVAIVIVLLIIFVFFGGDFDGFSVGRFIASWILPTIMGLGLGIFFWKRIRKNKIENAKKKK